MYDFSTLKTKTNKRFDSRVFNMFNEEHAAEYNDLMTKAHFSGENAQSGIEIQRTKDIISESTGSFAIFVEWVAYDNKVQSPYAASAQHNNGIK